MRRFLCLIALCSIANGSLARADESLPERTLKNIVAEQKAIIRDATAGETVNTSDLQAQLQQVCQRYDILLRDNPKFAPAYVSYALLLEKVGMRKASAALMTKANEIDPNLPVVKNQLGNYLAEEGKPLEALNYFLAAVDLAPDEPLYHFQLGTLLIEAKEDFIKSGKWTRPNLERAMIDAFRKASMLAPDDWRYAYRYGLAFYDLEDPQWGDALAFWKAFEAKLEPGAEQQICRLHEAKVLIEMKRGTEALAILDTITETSLQEQKAKLLDPARAAQKGTSAPTPHAPTEPPTVALPQETNAKADPAKP